MDILTPFNKLIMMAENAGLSATVYEAWNIVNLTVVAVFCLIYRKRYGFNRVQALLIPVLEYLFGYLFILLLGWAAMGFRYFGTNNIVKGFCFFPLIGVLVARWFKVDWKRMMDYCAPGFPLLQCVAHIACNFAGCCCGYPMEHGVWNPVWNQYLFPIQLLESLVSLLIFIACLIYARKQKYSGSGKVYPFFLITFGATRFCLEFLRCNTKLFWGISDLALWALLMVIVGIVWYAVLKSKVKAENKKNPKKKKA